MVGGRWPGSRLGRRPRNTLYTSIFHACLLAADADDATASLIPASATAPAPGEGRGTEEECMGR